MKSMKFITRNGTEMNEIKRDVSNSLNRLTWENYGFMRNLFLISYKFTV